MELRRLGRLENAALDPEFFDPLVKILDAGKERKNVIPFQISNPYS